MATRVILSSSTHPDYAFPVGIAALLWRDLVGYEPFVFTADTPERWLSGKAKVAYSFMCQYGIYIKTSFAVPLPEWPVYVTAQNCRYHAAVLPEFAADEWLMLSDADLFPLKREFYHQHEDYTGRFAFYYANGDHYDNYPTCHITARAKDWRDVMDLTEDGDIYRQMRENLGRWFAPRLSGLSEEQAKHVLWMVDMHSFMARIKSKPWHPSECRMIERVGHPPKDRLDRANWPASYNVENYTDAHILKNPCENYAKLRPMIEWLIPQHLARIDRYAEEFKRA